jgi:hypothetical protein
MPRRRDPLDGGAVAEEIEQGIGGAHPPIQNGPPAPDKPAAR